MLSSIDISNIKKNKLWLILILIIIFIIFIIYCFKPDHRRLKKQVNNSLIEVKYEDDSMKKWTIASELQLKNLENKQEKYKKILEKQNSYINFIKNKEAQQNIRLDKLEDKIMRLKIQKSIPAEVFSPDSYKNFNKDKSMGISRPIENKNKYTSKYNMAYKKQNNFLGWLPMGGFFKAILLNGIEAGTGSNAEANPQPVLMRITDNAILPNMYRYRIASCFVLGSAYGSLSSERAFIRTVEVSCVGHNGQAVVTAPLKGFVVDSDGKIGLRGLVVNRQGEKLGKAMLSGFFSGLSGVVGQVQDVSTTGSLGMANLLSTGASLRMAGLNGVSNATNELAQFYISEAKRLFPVIEVDAGRSVTINLSQGVSLRWQLITNQKN